MTVNGHVMGDHYLGLVYVTPQWFDESMLRSLTRRLATNIILQFDVFTTTQDFWKTDIALWLCVDAIQFVNFFQVFWEPRLLN